MHVWQEMTCLTICLLTLNSFMKYFLHLILPKWELICHHFWLSVAKTAIISIAAAAANVDNCQQGETDWSLHHSSHCHFLEGDYSNSFVIGFKWIRCQAGQSSSGHRCAVQTQPVVQAVAEREVSIWTTHMRTSRSWAKSQLDNLPWTHNCYVITANASHSNDFSYIHRCIMIHMYN